MAIKKNVVKMDFCSYPPIVILGEPKVGKSTLFRDLVLELYDDESKGLLISLGDEEGYLALDRLQYEVAEVWNKKEDANGNRGFVQVVDDVVKNNKEYGIKMVALDTYDKLVEIATNEVLKQHLIEKGQPCKSLNDAFGGFNRGKDRLVDMILEQIAKLRKAGIAVIIPAHTKFKEKTDVLTGEKYEVLTNNLRADIYSAVANIAQVIANIHVHRVIEDGKQIGESRLIHFRSNGVVDCGSRFNDMPEMVELSARNFIDAFEYGVKSSMLTPKTDKEIQEMKQKEVDELSNVVVEDVGIDLELNLSLKETIQSKFPNATPEQKTSIKEVMKENNIKDFKDVSEVKTEALEKIVSMLQ
jgi:GTPase SAR1 family protein